MFTTEAIVPGQSIWGNCCGAPLELELYDPDRCVGYDEGGIEYSQAYQIKKAPGHAATLEFGDNMARVYFNNDCTQIIVAHDQREFEQMATRNLWVLCGDDSRWLASFPSRK